MPEKAYIIKLLPINKEFRTYHIVIEQGVAIFRDENGYWQRFPLKSLNIETINLI